MTTIANAILHGSVSDVLNVARSNEHLNFIDEYGYTPLIETCIVDDIEKTKAILSFHPDVNMPDLVGNTALHWAVDNHNIEICELLLALGANPNAYTIAGMPVLVNPLLRSQDKLKQLLQEHGAQLTFAYDFINAKMLGHRFELKGFVDIVNTDGAFVEIGVEGFILEFTLNALRKSLKEYRENFAARRWQFHFKRLQLVIDALTRAAKLVRFQHYNVSHQQHMDKIAPLINQEPLVIPVAQEGHALTLIRCGHLLAMCDRATYEGQSSDEDKVVIYYMNKPWKLTADYVGELMYERQVMAVFHKMLPVHLGLQEVARMPLGAQVAGNCSWANIEACLPTLFYMLSMNAPGQSGDALTKDKNEAMSLYRDWQVWDQERSLDYFIQSFAKSAVKRQATIIEILCAVLFEACSADDPKDRARILKLVPIVKSSGFEYIPQSYITAYCHNKKTHAGKNFQRMLRMGADVFDFDD